MQCPQCKVEYESKHGAKTCGKEECVKQYSLIHVKTNTKGIGRRFWIR